MDADAKLTEQIDRTTFALQNAAAEVEAMIQLEKSRALSLTLTKVQEAVMWHGWHEGEQGRGASPMPSPHDLGDTARELTANYGSLEGRTSSAAASVMAAATQALIPLAPPPPSPARPAPPGSPLGDAMSILENAKAL